MRPAGFSFHKPRSPIDDDARILPLINVVFLLLIFFMLAGRLSSSDPFEVEPPRSTSEQPPEARTAEILVAADGRLALDGRTVDEAGLRAALTERLEDDPELRVWLRADGRSDTTRIVELMEMVCDAGAASLRLLTLAEAD